MKNMNDLTAIATALASMSVLDNPGISHLIEMSRRALSPETVPGIKSWVAGDEGAFETRRFSHGPEANAWEIMGLPDGHVIYGLDEVGQIMMRGKVFYGQPTDWNFHGDRKQLEDERQVAADALYQDLQIGNVIDDNGWETIVPGCEMRRDVFIGSEEDQEPSRKCLLTIECAPDSASIIEVTFDGEDITPSKADGMSLGM